MVRTFCLLIAMVSCFLSPQTFAAIYKCRGSDGSILYRNLPCPKGTTTLPLAAQSTTLKNEKPVTSPFSNQRINLEIADMRLPVGFVGHSATQIADALEEAISVTKGEFETTQQFEDRRKAALDRRLVGELNIGDSFVFSLDIHKGYGAISYSYDADSQTVTLRVNLSEISPNGIGGSVRILSGAHRALALVDRVRNPVKLRRLELSSSLSKSKEYAASNAVGARTVVSELAYEELSLAFDQFPFALTQRCELPIEKAQSLLQKSRILFEAKLVTPYIDFHFDRKKPTFDSPTDVSRSDRLIIADITKFWIYSPETGEVFARFARL